MKSGLVRRLAVLAVAVAAMLAVAGPAWAAFPGENGRIAFTSWRDGNGEIYSMNADGTNATRLTNNSSSDTEPVFSPDGTKIAFSSASFRDSIQDIYSMNADGTGLTRLTTNALYLPAAEPAFSPDGAKIAFTNGCMECNQELYVMNADGSGQTRLTINGSYDSEPVFSPDGSKIAFASERDRNFEIYSMDADGTNQTRLTNHASFDGQPDWQPLNAGRLLKPDLSVLSSDRPDPVAVGQELTYSLAVSNNGRSATAVVLTDKLPAGVEFISASAGCANDAGTVRCELGDLAKAPPPRSR